MIENGCADQRSVRRVWAQRRPRARDGGEPEDGGEAVAPAVAVGPAVRAAARDDEVGGGVPVGGPALEVRLAAVLHGEGAAAEGFEEVAALRVRDQAQFRYHPLRSQRHLIKGIVRSFLSGA